MSVKPTRAMVLAAGLGLRMRPLTDRMPKPMVSVAGSPLLDHVLDKLGAAGVGEAVVNVHYLPDQIIEHVAKRTRPRVVISDERDAVLGTGGGVIHLSSKEERLLAENGNPVLPPSRFSSNRPVFRSHVGIDLRIAQHVDFRYSFSEMIGQNEISKHLAPPAPRGLENFQNLFGFIVRF